MSRLSFRKRKVIAQDALSPKKAKTTKVTPMTKEVVILVSMWHTIKTRATKANPKINDKEWSLPVIGDKEQTPPSPSDSESTKDAPISPFHKGPLTTTK